MVCAVDIPQPVARAGVKGRRGTSEAKEGRAGAVRRVSSIVRCMAGAGGMVSWGRGRMGYEVDLEFLGGAELIGLTVVMMTLRFLSQ